jgi:gliding motility-associated-like protein
VYRIILGPEKITVSSSPLNFHLGNDTSLCQGQALVVNAGNGYAAYYWNTNFSDSTKSTIIINAKGDYWVTVKNQYGCTATDTIKVIALYPLPIASAGEDKNTCAGNTVELSASGGTAYQWSPGGKMQATINVSPSVTSVYTVTVYDSHLCSATDQVTVHVTPSNMKSPFTNNSIEHCFEEGNLNIGSSWGKSFLWSNTGDTMQYITVDSGGSYTVTVYNETGCYVTGTILIKEYCEPKIFVPKAFSPNGDGENDDLEIFGNYFTNFKITIFNRWGEIIFVSTDRNIRWDGNYRGEGMQIGTYPWIINYKSEYDDGSKEKTIKGAVTLIR